MKSISIFRGMQLGFLALCLFSFKNSVGRSDTAYLKGY